MEHIPTREFSESLDYETIWNIREQYRGEEWEYAKHFLSETKRITKSAIKVSEVMKEKLNIDLFPLIIKVATKGFDRAGGTASFMMFGPYGKAYSFEEQAKEYKSKRKEYFIDPDLFGMIRIK